MPTAKFRTTVIARENPSSWGQAIANCSKYLAYGDQTDTFGYHAHVESAAPPTTDAPAVTFEWQAPVASPDDLTRLEGEMARLSRVESHECVSNPVTAKD